MLVSGKLWCINVMVMLVVMVNFSFLYSCRFLSLYFSTIKTQNMIRIEF